jgi:hypothetical protein
VAKYEKYLLQIGFDVGTKQDSGFELSFRITHQHPAQGYGEQARGVPNGRLGSDLDQMLPAPIPVSDLGGLPNGIGILGHLRKVGQTFALETGPSPLSRTAHRSGLVEGGIQAADEGYRLA